MTTIEYRKNHWIRLGGDQVAFDADVAAYALTLAPDGPGPDELRRICELAGSAPTVSPGADRFVAVGEDGTWVLLEVNHLDDTPDETFDPMTDLPGLAPEKIQLTGGLSGVRVFSLQPSGELDAAEKSEPMVVRVDYFLQHPGGDGWFHAGAAVPDPVLVPAVIPLIDQLLSGITP